jgi:hypothetical protein
MNTPARLPLFGMGQIVATPAAIEFCKVNAVHPLTLIRRHCHGDFGEMDRQDIAANTQAIKSGARVFSSYQIGTSKVWIITEADRSSTCILLPDEY